MTNLKITVESSHDIYRAGGEIYHLQCARREHGDELVLGRLAAILRTLEGLSASESYIRAGQYFKDVDKTIDHGFGFKKIRAALDADLVMENALVCDSLLDPSY